MSRDEELLNEFTQKFPVQGEQTRILREGRIFIFVSYTDFNEIFNYATAKGFSHIGSITGLDEGENLSVIYHLCKIGDRTVINLKTSIPKSSPKIRSISDRFPVANLYERELVDLLGFEVEGLPADENRYPLSDSWPENQFPLRKDWDPKCLESSCQLENENSTNGED